MIPSPIDPKTQNSLVDRGIAREQEMLARAPKGELGPTMSCVFDDSIQDPLAHLSPEEMRIFGKMVQDTLKYRHAKKHGRDANRPIFLGVERAIFKKARASKPNRVARRKERAVMDKLEQDLTLSFEPIDAEMKVMGPEAKEVVQKAINEFKEPVWLEEGQNDIVDDMDVHLAVFDEIMEEGTTLLPPLTVDFLDVGMGDSTLFVCSDGTTVLIDCGSASSLKDGAIDAMKFLEIRLKELQAIRNLDKPKIDRIYVTHADRDHYNLLPTLFHLLPDLEVTEFHIGGKTKEYKATLDVLDVKSTGKTLLTMSDIFKKSTVIEYSAGYTGNPGYKLESKESATGGPVSFKTLCANSVPCHGETKTNAASVVVLVEMAVNDEKVPPVKLLMMGDGETTVEDVLVAKHKKDISDCTFVHIGHHGSQIAANEEFLKVVDPRVAQVSADQNWAHPYRTTIERITENPNLRINEAMQEDATHPIVVGEGSTSGKNRVHTQLETRAALIMNVSEQKEDLKSEKAKDILERNKKAKTPKDVVTPTKVYGEQWRVEFQADGSFRPFSTRRDEGVDFL